MIGIISDTHEQACEVKKAVEILKQKKVDFVVHCGDIISPPILDFFKGLKMKIIFGNNDGEKIGLAARAKSLGFEEITETKEFDYEGKKFFVCHGHKQDVLENAIKSQRYDYVLTGHNHQKRNEKIEKTRVINPGSLFSSEENTIAILDTKNDKVEFIEV